MTIDETIQLLRFNNKHFADLDNKDLLQMSDWLEELKAYRASVFSGDMTQAMLKEEYNKAIDDVMKKAKEIQEEQIKNLEQSPRNSGKRWAVYMNTHLGHIQIACKRLIADHPAKESED